MGNQTLMVQGDQVKMHYCGLLSPGIGLGTPEAAVIGSWGPHTGARRNEGPGPLDQTTKIGPEAGCLGHKEPKTTLLASLWKVSCLSQSEG